MTTIRGKDLHPYFQVTVYQWPEKAAWPLSDLKDHITKQSDERSEFSVQEISLDELPALNADESFSLLHVTHHSVPTWVRGNLEKALTSTEHDLIILIQSGAYLFAHASCEAVATAVTGFLSTRFELATVQKMVALAALPQITFRAMGINNLFMPGGTAPESKAYYSRDALQVLSTLDRGYAFRYGMGAIGSAGGGRPKPIGISPRKAKVWGGWSSDIHGFVEDCRTLGGTIDQLNPDEGFDVLVNPATGSFASVEPIMFSMDYYDPKSGMVVLGKDKRTFTPNWVCYLSDEVTAQGEKIVHVRIDDDVNPYTKLVLHKEADGSWTIKYQPGVAPAFVVLSEDDEDLKGKHRRDLVEYLNDKENFTILLEQGVAYRDSVYYRDNRFLSLFERSEDTTVSWQGVDIRKEEQAPRASFSKNIAQAVMDSLQTSYFGVHVNGSGEVADFVVLHDGHPRKFILVHAKYSCEDNPGLRVGDLQEVCSQAVKNLRYLTPTYLGKETDDWHASQFTLPAKDQATCNALVEKALADLPSMDREVWIVQPGISKAQLGADKGNKIHALLNYVDACCRINNAVFRFICSP